MNIESKNWLNYFHLIIRYTYNYRFFYSNARIFHITDTLDLFGLLLTTFTFLLRGTIVILK